MHYEINVAKNGKHFFATSERSLQTKSQMKEVYDSLVVAFPETEGFTISVSKWQSVGETIDPKSI